MNQTQGKLEIRIEGEEDVENDPCVILSIIPSDVNSTLIIDKSG